VGTPNVGAAWEKESALGFGPSEFYCFRDVSRCRTNSCRTLMVGDSRLALAGEGGGAVLRRWLRRVTSDRNDPAGPRGQACAWYRAIPDSVMTYRQWQRPRQEAKEHQGTRSLVQSPSRETVF
jgi:hypothetical protein